MMLRVRITLALLVAVALAVAALGIAFMGAASAGPASAGAASAGTAAPTVGEQAPPVVAPFGELAQPYDWTDPACAGSKLRYTLTFTNGPDPLSGAILSDTIPAESEFLPGDSSSGAIHDGARNVRWAIPPLEPGAVVTRDLVVRLSNTLADGAIVTDSVEVLAPVITATVQAADGMVSSGVASEETTVTQCVDLAPPHDWADPTCAGWLLRYTITFTNTGSSTLTGVVLSDTLQPALVQYVSSSDDGIYDGDATVWWAIPDVSPGQVVVRDLWIRPYSYVVPGTIISNTAQVLTDQLISEQETQGTRIQGCVQPSKTPTITLTPTNTATPTATAIASETPTPTATAASQAGGQLIFMPMVLKNWEP